MTDNRNTIQDLSRGISERCRTTRKDSDNFVRLFFDLIYEAVLDEKLVKVKGLGTFKLVEVMDRESVNVNTGERFVIPGHSKVSFTPEPALRDRINRPFNNLPTEIIHDGTPIELMEIMDEDPITIREAAEGITPYHTSAPVEPVREEVHYEEEISTPSAMHAPEEPAFVPFEPQPVVPEDVPRFEEPIEPQPLMVEPQPQPVQPEPVVPEDPAFVPFEPQPIVPEEPAFVPFEPQPIVPEEPAFVPFEPQPIVPEQPAFVPFEPQLVEPETYEETVFEPLSEQPATVVSQREQPQHMSVQPSLVSHRSLTTGVVLQPIGSPVEPEPAKDGMPIISAESSMPRPKPVPAFRDTAVKVELPDPFTDDPLPHMEGVDIIPADIEGSKPVQEEPHKPFIPANGPVEPTEFITQRTHPDEKSLAHPAEPLEDEPVIPEEPEKPEEPQAGRYEVLPMDDAFEESVVLQPIETFGEQSMFLPDGMNEMLDQPMPETPLMVDEPQQVPQEPIVSFDTNPIILDDLPMIGMPETSTPTETPTVSMADELPMLSDILQQEPQPEPQPEPIDLPMIVAEEKPAPVDLPIIGMEEEPEPIYPEFPSTDPEPILQPVEPLVTESEPILQPVEPLVAESEPILQPVEPLVAESEPEPQPEPEPEPEKPRKTTIPMPSKRDFASDMHFLRMAFVCLIAVLLIVVSYFAGNAKLLLDPVSVEPEIPIVHAEPVAVDVVKTSPVKKSEPAMDSPYFIAGDLGEVVLTEENTLDNIIREHYPEYSAETDKVLTSIKQYNEVSDVIVIGVGSRIRLPKLQRREVSAEINNP